MAGAAFAAEVNGGLTLGGDALTFKTADKSVVVASPTSVSSRNSGISVSSERAGLSLSFASASDASGYNLWVKPIDALKMSFVKSYGSTSFALDFQQMDLELVDLLIQQFMIQKQLMNQHGMHTFLTEQTLVHSRFQLDTTA